MVDPLGELHIDIVEGALEWRGNSAVAWKCGGGCRAEDSVIGLGEEQGGAQSEVGDAGSGKLFGGRLMKPWRRRRRS